jgi:hypothetical protein
MTRAEPAGRVRADRSLQGLRRSRKLALQAVVLAGDRMLSGFNTNVRHRGVLFHVQTEDSGRNHPHVITHLYHGGTILASEKSSYKELLEEGDLQGKVRALMEGQHAAMLARLRGGELDDVLADRLGPEVFAATKAAGASGHTQRTGAPAVAPAPPAPALTPRPSDRPLDELILDYLVDHTRRGRRQRSAKLE